MHENFARKSTQEGELSKKDYVFTDGYLVFFLLLSALGSQRTRVRDLTSKSCIIKQTVGGWKH